MELGNPDVPWRILLKYTDVPKRVPSEDILRTGEVAINIHDGIVYTLDATGKVVKIAQNYDPLIAALVSKINQLEVRISELEK